jgi:hypothetical protein
MRKHLALVASRLLAGTMTILGLTLAADEVLTSAWEIMEITVFTMESVLLVRAYTEVVRVEDDELVPISLGRLASPADRLRLRSEEGGWTNTNQKSASG